MKASELIARLQEAVAEHGDKDIAVSLWYANEKGIPSRVKLIKPIAIKVEHFEKSNLIVVDPYTVNGVAYESK